MKKDEDVLGKAYDARMVRRLAAWVRPYRGLVALTLVLLAAVSAAQLVQPYLLKLAIDGYIVRREAAGLLLPVGLFLGALIAEFVLGYFQLYVLEKTGQNVVLDLRQARDGRDRVVPAGPDRARCTSCRNRQLHHLPHARGRAGLCRRAGDRDAVRADLRDEHHA